MKALRIVEPGRADLVDVPEPPLGPGEVSSASRGWVSAAPTSAPSAGRTPS